MSDIYLSLTETPSVVTLSQPVIASSVAATVTVGNTVTVALDANSLSALENVTVTVGAAVSVSNFPSTQTIAGTVTANITNSVTVGAIIGPAGGSCLQGISGSGDAVRIVLQGRDSAGNYSPIVGSGLNQYNIPIYGTVTVGNSVTISSLPAISGTVTANLRSELEDQESGYFHQLSRVFYFDESSNYPIEVKQSSPFPVSGTFTIGNSVTISALPSGALTTRFGSVTTANTAQITSAVTNTNRKYLLAQNISAGTVTIGIGFSPTTTQGIQLAAGGGLTFDAFCPTGAVYWLGAVTGAAYTILEG